MKVALLVLVITVAALVASSHAAARALCTPTSTSTGRTFCGPATATLKLDGKKYVFKSGRCELLNGGIVFSLNLGAQSYTGKPKHMFFGMGIHGIAPGKHTYTDTFVDWQFPGTVGSNKTTTIYLAKGAKSGTFSGVDRQDGSKDSGSFNCG